MKQFFIVTTLALLLFTSTPSKAYAVFTDPVQAIKELGTDMIAWIAGGTLMGELIRETTQWASTGFTVTARTAVFDPVTGELRITITPLSGDPTFVTNPNEFFKGVTVDSAATFYEQLTTASSDPDQALNVIFPGFKTDLLKETARNTQGMSGTFFDNFESDLQEAELDAYLDDFTTGGWEMFLRTTQNCANNYSCARLAVLSELDSRVTGAVTEKQTELDQSGGFLTIRKCVETSDTEPGGCLKYENVTPGQIIAEQMTRGATSELDRYLQVDETSEGMALILEAMISKLMNMGSEGGLSSLWEVFERDRQDYIDGWAREKAAAEAERDRVTQEMEDKQSEMDEEKDEFRDALDVDGESGSGSDSNTGSSCATATGGNVCTGSTDIDMRADYSGASHKFNVVYTGTQTFESDVQYDFGEFNDNVTVITSSGSGTGVLKNGDRVEVVVRVNNPDLIEDFNDFKGVVTIGGLKITIRGVDRRY